MEPEFFAAIAAWFGVGVSWIYSRRAYQAAKDSASHEQAALEAQQQAAAAAQQLADLEANREAQRKLTQAAANVRAELAYYPGSHSSLTLSIVNDGPAIANIRSIRVEDYQVNGHDGPLNPNSRHKAHLGRQIAPYSPPWRVRIEWEDGRDGLQEWQQRLSADE